MLLQYVSVQQRKTASDTLLQFTMRWDEMLHSYTAKSALLKNNDFILLFDSITIF